MVRSAATPRVSNHEASIAMSDYLCEFDSWREPLTPTL